MSGTPRVIPNVEACIDCGGCEVACMRTWELPEESDRIGVVTHNEGTAGSRFDDGETAVPMTCFHCAEAPCEDVCPTDAISRDDDGLVQVDEDTCLGCSYCAWACPFGAPQFPDEENSTGNAGVMDKCTLCAPRLEEGEEPACVSECATDALVFGTPAELSEQFRENRSDDLFDGDLEQVVFGNE
ncbi:4Fe-4S dicluster domain-containing protein [Natrarchaeobaculum sulfurireducens]|uniref:Fe-S-cluster-containing dehydrogenase component n=1 Tax=Natrarchaeobaculum sulfurireducens TaxID=2044521 RepID=A0A346PE53_9EURY|nr:4Fe-4S dicluster domain-containing protein [Natrarchaeobaculum sulfurireducens]AXR77798.1 Fe-S-cluster-containing dehydrogenase component [Natrarchaeobaculum sulfurireducens]